MDLKSDKKNDEEQTVNNYWVMDDYEPLDGHNGNTPRSETKAKSRKRNVLTNGKYIFTYAVFLNWSQNKILGRMCSLYNPTR